MPNNQMTITETSREGRPGSKSQSGGRTSVLTSSGSFWLWLLGLSLCVLAVQSAWLSEVYDAFRSLPPLDQFAVVCAVSLFAFGYAVTVREFRTDFGERWAARIVGICGVCFLLAFSFRMASTVEKLQTQLAGNSYEKRIPVAHEIGDMVAEAEFAVTTPAGRQVSWNGGSGPMSITNRCVRWSARGAGDAAVTSRRQSGSIGGMPAAASTIAGRK